MTSPIVDINNHPMDWRDTAQEPRAVWRTWGKEAKALDEAARLVREFSGSVNPDHHVHEGADEEIAEARAATRLIDYYARLSRFAFIDQKSEYVPIFHDEHQGTPNLKGN